MNICNKEIEIKVEGRLIRTARLADEGYEFLEHPETAIAGLRNGRTRVDLFTFTQPLAKTPPLAGYAIELDNLAVLPITTFDDWFKGIGFKTRNHARLAAKKGVIVRETPWDDKLAHGIWRIYNECPIRQGRRFRHYNQEFETVRAMTATFLASSIFIGAFQGEELIGFLKLTTDESRSQAGIMNILSMVKHRDKSPTNALLAQAVRTCAERGVANLVYSKFSYGKKHDSLRDFKEHNGFQRADVPRYYAPLTLLGQYALRLGLHKRTRQYVPEIVLDKIHKVRATWYKRKYGPA
jgi:hypothetical protein